MAEKGVTPMPPATHSETRYAHTSSVGLLNGPSMKMRTSATAPGPGHVVRVLQLATARESSYGGGALHATSVTAATAASRPFSAPACKLRY